MCKLIQCIISTFKKKIYNLNRIIVIIFNCINAYAQGYTLIKIFQSSPDIGNIV